MFSYFIASQFSMQGFVWLFICKVHGSSVKRNKDVFCVDLLKKKEKIPGIGEESGERLRNIALVSILID